MSEEAMAAAGAAAEIADEGLDRGAAKLRPERIGK